MQLLKPTDTPADSPFRGHVDTLRHRFGDAFDAARRGLVERTQSITAAVRRRARANSLVRIRQGRISVGIDVGDLGLSRLEPADVGG